ncbi:polyprenyl synthetase family protein [Leifsonia kafniensis]|uniref:Polyprenyl synthetase family protein n=1 Tax=Leifsonia kafniensis TaxID=475957 RepID=A0ABP7KPB4_9MICO
MPDLIAAGVDTELERYLAAARLRASDYGEHYVALWEALAQASSGGKRGRPALVLAAYAGFGGTDLPLALPVAVSFELLHTAFIIHDDVIDRDLTRRGSPNVAGEFTLRAIRHGASADQAGVWATTAGILAGDLALSEAHRAIATLPTAPHIRGRLLDLLDRAVFVTAAGELADVTNTALHAPVTLSEVLTTLERKTALYSFEAPLQAGAILAGASASALDVLGRFGRLVGVAFQLADDVLGVFGDPAVTGKSALSDLREGKFTALIACARTTDAWPAIAPFIGTGTTTNEEAELVRAHLRACGAVQAVDELAYDHIRRAIDVLDSPDVPQALRETLIGLTETAADRQR